MVPDVCYDTLNVMAVVTLTVLPTIVTMIASILLATTGIRTSAGWTTCVVTTMQMEVAKEVWHLHSKVSQSMLCLIVPVWYLLLLHGRHICIGCEAHLRSEHWSSWKSTHLPIMDGPYHSPLWHEGGRLTHGHAPSGRHRPSCMNWTDIHLSLTTRPHCNRCCAHG
jgi:hypothetical protein